MPVVTRWLSIVITLSCLLSYAAMPVQANAPVEVLGLFKDRAVLRVPGGRETMVRVGETEQGATLLSATAQGAKVRFQGQVYKLGLSRNVRGAFQSPKKTSVSLNADHQGQYRVTGQINNSQVRFLVDTGATVVALSSQQADQLGIDYRSGQRGRVQTAQGIAQSHFVNLAQVSVGDVQAQNVRAAVIDGAYPRDVLLGMSFLQQVKMQQESGVLMLAQKF